MKNDFLILIIFFAFLTIIAAGNDSYTVYQKQHTFRVAYESVMNCRAAIAKNGDLNTLQYAEKTCGSIPTLEDYK